MKISKSSWHVNVNDYVYGYGYTAGVHSLCPYFWKTIIAIIFLPLVAICRITSDKIDESDVSIPNIPISIPSISDQTKSYIGKGFLVTFILLIGIGLAQAGDSIGWFTLATIILGVLGVLGAIFGIVFLVVCLEEKYSDWRYEHPKNGKPYKEPKPNILLEYIKAWKNKNCPLLELTED